MCFLGFRGVETPRNFLCLSRVFCIFDLQTRRVYEILAPEVWPQEDLVCLAGALGQVFFKEKKGWKSG